MNVTPHKTKKNTFTVVLADGEEIFAIMPKAYYKLGGQLDDVVHAGVITDSQRVYWDSISQKWSDD
jgi:hypothetical protein